MPQPWDYIAKVVNIGDSATGKTSLTLRLCEGRFQPEHNVTIGVEFGSRVIDVNDGQQTKRIKLQIWDTAGQETFRAITKSYFRGSTGALLVYDITCRSTFESIKAQWLSELRNSANPNICIILVGNKSDLESQRQVSKKEAETFATENGMKAFVETSAKNGDNVEKAFVEVAKEIYRNIRDGAYDLKDKSSGIKVNTAKANLVVEDAVTSEAGGCC